MNLALLEKKITELNDEHRIVTRKMEEIRAEKRLQAITDLIYTDLKIYMEQYPISEKEQNVDIPLFLSCFVKENSSFLHTTIRYRLQEEENNSQMKIWFEVEQPERWKNSTWKLCYQLVEDQIN